MSVIAELSLSPSEFELGRILDLEGGTDASLETMVPLGKRAVPFFRLGGDARDSFEEQVRTHPAVYDIHVVNTTGSETLYAIDWQITRDSFFQGLLSQDAHVLEATGTASTWSFEIRFPSHDALAAFRQHCIENGVDISVERVFNPTRPDAGQWYGLTAPQRETIRYAVEHGYYDIPRRISTQDIAEHFDVSDQAITERLRRAIDTMVSNTLLLPEQDG